MNWEALALEVLRNGEELGCGTVLWGAWELHVWASGGVSVATPHGLVNWSPKSYFADAVSQAVRGRAKRS